MGLIAVDRAEAGMILHADVVDLRGRLLIPAGRALSEKPVAALPMWGVAHIDIAGPDPATAAEPAIDPAILERAEAVVADRFANAGAAHAFLDELRRVCVKRTATELARSDEVPA
jgi:hypothetical protein